MSLFSPEQEVPHEEFHSFKLFEIIAFSEYSVCLINLGQEAGPDPSRGSWDSKSKFSEIFSVECAFCTFKQSKPYLKNVIWLKDWKCHVGNGLHINQPHQDAGLLLVVTWLCYLTQFRRPFPVGRPGALFLNIDMGIASQFVILILWVLGEIVEKPDYIVIMKGFLR